MLQCWLPAVELVFVLDLPKGKSKACVRVKRLHAQFVIKKTLIIHLTLGIAMFAATIVAGTSTSVVAEDNPVVQQMAGNTDSTEISEIPTESKSEPLTTKEKVEDYFKDIPILADVAFCESRYRQYDQNGNALRGIVNKADVGVMQINEKYHAETAVKLGYDLYSLEGNMAYARYLYSKQGTKPWVHSSTCWNKTQEVALR